MGAQDCQSWLLTAFSSQPQRLSFNQHTLHNIRLGKSIWENNCPNWFNTATETLVLAQAKRTKLLLQFSAAAKSYWGFTGCTLRNGWISDGLANASSFPSSQASATCPWNLTSLWSAL